MAIYNMATVVGKAVNLPVIGNEGVNKLPPLYRRVSGYNYEMQNAEGGSASQFQDPLWLKEVEKVLNSPTNVRRIFLGNTSVEVDYYQPIKINDKMLFSLRRKYDLNGQSSISDVVDAVQMDNTNKERIHGNPFKGIVLPYALSNVEEIYISDTFFTPYNIDIVNAEAVQIMYKNIKNGQDPLKIQRAEGIGLKEMLASALNVDTKMINTKMPRLRYIGIVNNLDWLIENRFTNQLMANSTIRQSLSLNDIHMREPKTKDDVMARWISELDKAKDHFQNVQMEPIAVLYEIVEYSDGDKLSPYIKFAPKRINIYQMDYEVLDSYFDHYSNTALSIARADQFKDDKATDLQEDNGSELMDFLNQRKAAFNNDLVFNAILKAVYQSYSSAEKEQIYSQLSTEFQRIVL